MADPNLFIELDHTDFFYPGQIVTGRVVRIVVGRDEQIRSFTLNVQGYGKTWWQTHIRVNAGQGVTTTIPITHQNHATYFEHSFPLDQRPDETWTRSIPHGRNSFPFEFVLPVGIPASFSHNTDNTTNSSHEETKIYYQAKAIYATQIGPEVTALLDFNVERPIDLNIYPWATQSNSVEGEKFLCCCCCRSGPISFKLHFNKTGFLVGERIEFLADLVNNTSKNIQVIQAWISKTVDFRGTDDNTYYAFKAEPIGPVRLLPKLSARERIEVPVSFDLIPTDYQPINDFGSNFMQSFHQLHIKMVIPGAFNLKGSIRIVIGNVPFVIQTPTSSHTTFQGLSQSQSRSLAQSPSVVQ